MHRQKSIQILGILAVLWSITPIVLAAEEPAYSARDLAQSVIHHPPALSDAGAAAKDAVPSVRIPAVPQAAEKPALEPAHSKTAIQPDESFNDRLIALGIAAVILVFAFFRRKPRQSSPAIKDVESSALPSPAESTSPVELVVVEPSAAILAAIEEPITAQALGKNIVVPVDFSPNSELAMRLALVWSTPNDKLSVVYACDLEKAFPPGKLTPSNLSAVHPAFENIDNEIALHWSRSPWVEVLPLAMEIIEHWAFNEFEKLRDTLPIANGERIRFHVMHGDPVDQIVKFSEDVLAKLIVLVAHRHSFTDRFITGSHADTLLHVSRIPVIVLCEPVKSELGLPQDIIITTDYSPESLPVFLVLKDLLKAAKPNITVLTVETAHEHQPQASAIFEALENTFRLSGLELRNVKIEAPDVEAAILDYVKTHQPQLIAMSTHGRLGFAELIHPSVTKAILHEAGVPILVVHGQAIPSTKTVGSLSDVLRIITG